MNWITLEITNPADREAMAAMLFRYGYAVRPVKRKEENKTAIFIEYRKDVQR